MVDGDNMGSGLQVVGVRFSNFLLRKLSREFKVRVMSIFHEIQMVIFQYYVRLQSQGSSSSSSSLLQLCGHATELLLDKT